MEDAATGGNWNPKAGKKEESHFVHTMPGAVPRENIDPTPNEWPSHRWLGEGLRCERMPIKREHANNHRKEQSDNLVGFLRHGFLFSNFLDA